jgi:hypothetical protein
MINMIDKCTYINHINYEVSKILSLLDKNKLSKTFGCFDRNYWHYKIKDFPSGMSQEFTLVLALVYSVNYKNNKFYKNLKVREYIESGIQSAIDFTHSDGCTDDYYPYERALGATVFSLYALTESYLLLDLKDEKFIDFFRLRADWILSNEESGKLTNHHVIAALSLYNTYLITRDIKYKKEFDRKLEHVYSWQTEEGWYWEYEGCDPGYLTVSIDFLAQIYEKTNDKKTLTSLSKAIDFFYKIQHPDGTAGGEYGSRNTLVFHPAGFEIMSTNNYQALQISNSYLRALDNELLANITDDYIIGHGLISRLNAFRYSSDRDYSILNNNYRNNTNTHYKLSNFYIYSHQDKWSIFNLEKGGVAKIYKNTKLMHSDSGVILENSDGKFVSSILDKSSSIEILDNKIVISKNFMKYKQHYATQFIFLLFRGFLFSFGRFKFSSIFLRRYFQRKMITGKNKMPFIYNKEISFNKDQINIKHSVGNIDHIDEIYLSSDLVPMYVAVSECFEQNSLDSSWKNFQKESDTFTLEEEF